jgi:uncharacterized protein (TIGR02266 family)
VLEVPVDIESENNFYAGITGDVSEGGVFVATHAAPPADTAVMILLTLPGHEPLELPGVVRWIRSPQAAGDGLPPGCGVKWLELPEQGRSAIARFVEEREPIFFEE